jgi:DNA mismatch repair protein MutS2
LPGRSNALAIAERLGLQKTVIDYARTGIRAEDLRAEDLLADLYEQRDVARHEREEAEFTHKEAEGMYKRLAKRLETIEDERIKILETARKEGEKRVEEVETELRELRRKLARARQPLDVIEEVEDDLAELDAEVLTPTLREDTEPDSAPTRNSPRRAFRLGDKVHVPHIGSNGVLTAISEDEAEVQIGVMRVRTRLSELIRPSDRTDTDVPSPAEVAARARGLTPDPAPKPKSVPKSASYAPGIELDIRGKRVDEALDLLDNYLDTAYMAEMPWARIIHGKGTGRLRKAVRDRLREHSFVASFESGQQGEGGDGVTVVKFRE